MAMAEMKIFISHFVKSFELVEFLDSFDMTELIVAESNNAMRLCLCEYISYVPVACEKCLGTLTGLGFETLLGFDRANILNESSGA